jgi:GNAT superfamily N-acetyltransferase
MPPLPSSAPLPPRTFRLRDGRDYRLRPLHADDAPLLAEMFAGLAPASIHARYGWLIRDMTPGRAHHLVAADSAREDLLGILELQPDGQECLRAIGRLVLAPDGGSAECAFLVHDDRRRLGMATRLLRHLCLLGRRRHLPRIFAQVRRENRPMLATFRRAGAQLHFDPGGEVVEINIPLRDTKILFDNSGSASSPAPMAAPEKKSFSPVRLVIDLILCAGFFSFIFSVIKSHVPSIDPKMITLWGALAAGCLTGVFWLAMQMVKTVFRFQTGPRQ